MAALIDFTNCPVNRLKLFGGANGNKISITYAGDNYMLKFPHRPRKNPMASYTNSCISEYLACHIIQSLGISTQETLLGTYNGKVVVACKDLETNGYLLEDFAYLKNAIVDSEQNGYGTELAEIMQTFDEQQIISTDKLKVYFWDMLIADAFVGNFDRHNGNWGFLINQATGDVQLSPIYDCGSCLYPQLDDAGMANVLNDPEKIRDRLYVFPTSAIYVNGKKLNYAEFLATTQNEDCLAALQRIAPRIDLAKIGSIINNTPSLSDTQVDFYKTMLAQRNACIIVPALERARAIDHIQATAPSLHQICADAKDRAAEINAEKAAVARQPERERE